MLYLIRHGQTDWNKEHKLQGTTDIPLNDTGRKMAQEAAETVQDIPFDICFVSPLQRARQTVELLLKGRNIPVEVDGRLQEISFGIYEGIQNFFQDDEGPLYDFFHTPEQFDAKGKTESFEELYARTASFLEEKVKPLLRQEKNVLIVGHGAMNLSIYNQIYHVPLAHFWDKLMKNCEIISIPEEDVLRYCRDTDVTDGRSRNK